MGKRQQKRKIMPLVSIIVPIYNVEKYLDGCLQSITGQTYTNLEIILIDDKTSDSSGSIADAWEKRDSRIKVIHKEKNEGINMARATGFEHSAGEFVMFVDSDDQIRLNTVQRCLDVLVEYGSQGAEFVRFGVQTYKDHYKIPAASKQDAEPKLIKGKRDLFLTQINGVSGIDFVMTVWGGLYLKSAIKKINWKAVNYRMYEDDFWMLEFLGEVNGGVYIVDKMYLYHFDDTITDVQSKSIAGNNYNGKPIGYLELVKILVDEYNKYNKRHSFGLSAEIGHLARCLYAHRLEMLLKNNALDLENNREYIPNALKCLCDGYRQYERDNAMKQNEINNLKEAICQKDIELASFASVKRSARLLAGNIKRRLSPRLFEGHH